MHRLKSWLVINSSSIEEWGYMALTRLYAALGQDRVATLTLQSCVLLQGLAEQWAITSSADEPIVSALPQL
jgi:hypothetical protein